MLKQNPVSQAASYPRRSGLWLALLLLCTSGLVQAAELIGLPYTTVAYGRLHLKQLLHSLPEKPIKIFQYHWYKNVYTPKQSLYEF